ncbi:MAG TPA: hypothetical protein PLD23_13795 [Armatimonadota bacterium]|nr:hypothetical protein [Armatimonadota bacterium]
MESNEERERERHSLSNRLSFIALPVALALAGGACSAQVVPPTVVSVSSKVFTPMSGSYVAGQMVTGATEHRAVFNTLQADFLPCRLRLVFSQYPSWAQSAAYGDTQDHYTYVRHATVPMFAQPNPRLKTWYIPNEQGPKSYAFVATTIVIPASCSQTYGPPPPPVPAEKDRPYTEGVAVEGSADVTQINVP